MKKVTTTFAAVLLLGVAASGFAQAAVAAPTAGEPAGRIVAQDQSTQLQAVATAPREITVRTQPGARVAIQPTRTTAKTNTKPITKRANNEGVAVFNKLTAGQRYSVRSAGETTTTLPVVAVGRTTGLTVRATEDPTSVDLSWEHTSTAARGGSTITYRVSATPLNKNDERAPKPTVTKETNDTQALLIGLDPTEIYEFEVYATNALGPGQPSIARMSEPLAALTGSKVVPTTPTENSRSVPNSRPAPAPAPAPGPGTRTIYVCPSGYRENAENCSKTTAYTFTTRAYTFSDQIETSPYTYRTEVTGPSPVLDTYETPNVCPSGYNLEDYGAQGKWCKLYGPAPTAQVKNAPPAGWTDNGSAYQRTIQVKDATPAGFTDNGNEWIKKDAPPAGWTDNGTQYVHTVPKEARTVPA